MRPVPRPSQTLFFDGPAGALQTLVDEPDEPRGLALAAHPHPLLGGTNTNKVVYTLAHALRDLGYLALRPNFRGVGKSAGTHAGGEGETDDLLAVLAQAEKRWPALATPPVVLAGFSFGAYVQTRVAKRLREAGRPVERIILVGLATGGFAAGFSYQADPLPADALLIHGEQDATVPLANVTAYAKPLGLRVTVVAGADHFFHGRLQDIRAIIAADMRDR
jgi:alpha/beta superfamily hydrolase